MMSSPPVKVSAAPDWFGSAAQAIAVFPVAMSGYAIFYALWWPLAWGWAGAAAFLIVLGFAAFLVVRGVEQMRHAARFPSNPTPEDQRTLKAMTVLNSVTHPIWMLGSILLLVLGQGRWALPLMVFVIGAHFLPMARILGRRIDYVLGPLTILAAVLAGAAALDDGTSWLVVFAIAGVGGAASTLSYAIYLARDYRRLCARAGIAFPLSD